MSVPVIGDMRHRLVLERVERSDDGGGGVMETWVAEATVWAAIGPLSGSETMEAGRIAGRHMFEITTRYRPGMSLAMRFRKEGRIFHILSLENIGERGRWLKAICEEREL